MPPPRFGVPGGMVSNDACPPRERGNPNSEFRKKSLLEPLA